MKAYECMADSSSSCMKGYILYILATDLSHVVSGGFASSTVQITFCKWMFSQCRIAGLHELLIFASLEKLILLTQVQSLITLFARLHSYGK